MAEFKYLDIDVAAWIRDTYHLRPVARGIYMDLIMLAWSEPKCRLPNDPKWLAGRLLYKSDEIPIMRDVVKQFWKPDQRGKWLHQKRLDKEWKASECRKMQGLEGANRRWNKDKTQSGNARTVTETVTETGSTPKSPQGDLGSLLDFNSFQGGNNGRRRRQGPVTDEFIERLGAALDRTTKRH